MRNIKILYRAGSLMAVEKKYLNISKFWREYRRSDGTRVAPNQQVNIRVYFSRERGMRIMN
jgi:hypothetical protein